ncbi:MAG: hypothetical protein ABR574_11330, partial [Cryomorphaceae bacterium]
DVNGNSTSANATVTVTPGEDQDLDGITDACDFCFGDNSSGDIDGDGICDSDDSCPGSGGFTSAMSLCDFDISSGSGDINANEPVIYCISGNFNGENISITNGA